MPRQLGLSRSALEANGFEGKPGQILAVPSSDGVAIAIGVGDPGAVDANGLRSAAASFARAASKHAHLAVNLADLDEVDARAAGQAVTEGVLLASYRYTGLKNDPANASRLESLTLVVGDKRRKAVEQGAERGHVVAGAATFARELANTPPTYLNAKDLAAKAVALGSGTGLTVEVFNKDQLKQMGCGGLLGVNRGSTEPPRMIKLSWSPKNPTGHLALVGKGIMYDSGGISLKPSDHFHQNMKMDMSGAAAVLATMSTLKALKCRAKVTAWLMCTDNMPSGSALKLGDVLTMRNGKTVEIHNTDAEGRLVLADGLSLAVEEQPDAIVDIATLTGAVLVRARPERRRPARQQPGVHRSGRGAGSGHGRAGVAAAARLEALPQAARFRGCGHEEHRRPARRDDHGVDLPQRVRRRRSLGAPRHRRADDGRRRRRDLRQGRHRIRHAPADRPRHQLHPACVSR